MENVCPSRGLSRVCRAGLLCVLLKNQGETKRPWIVFHLIIKICDFHLKQTRKISSVRGTHTKLVETRKEMQFTHSNKTSRIDHVLAASAARAMISCSCNCVAALISSMLGGIVWRHPCNSTKLKNSCFVKLFFSTSLSTTASIRLRFCSRICIKFGTKSQYLANKILQHANPFSYCTLFARS